MRSGWSLMLFAFLVGPAGAQIPFPVASSARGVTVTIIGEGVAPADTIEFTLTLSRTAPTHLEAWESIQEAYRETQEVLRGLNLPEESIVVEGPSFASPRNMMNLFGFPGMPGANPLLQPEAEEAEQPPAGVQAKITFTVRFPFEPAQALPSLQRAERFRTAVQEAGLNVAGPRFTRHDLTVLERAAVENALTRARTVAEAVAAGSQRRLRGIQWVMVFDYEEFMRSMFQSMFGGGFMGQIMQAIFGAGGETRPFAVKVRRMVVVSFAWE